MANSLVRLPLPYVGDFNKGRPLFNAKLFIGEPDLDPEIPANQKTVTGRQEDGTLVAMSQPVRTSSGGYPIYNNAPIELLVDGAYSLKVLDKNDNQTYYFANVEDGKPVTFDDKPVLYRDTVADAKADVDLTVGMYVTTKGYHSPNDGGGANYVVVAGGTGTADGVLYIDKTDGSGHQLQLTHNGVIKAAQGNVLPDGSDVTIKLQTLITAALGKTLIFERNSTYNITATTKITIPSSIKIEMNESIFESAVVATSDFAIEVSGDDITIDNLSLNYTDTATTSLDARGILITGSNFKCDKVSCTGAAPSYGGNSSSNIGVYLGSSAAMLTGLRVGVVETINWDRPVVFERLDDWVVDTINITTYRRGLYVKDCTKGTLLGGRISGLSPTSVGGPGDNSILIEATIADYSTRYLNFHNLLLEDAGEHSFRLGGGKVAADILVSDSISKSPGSGPSATGGAGFKCLGATVQIGSGQHERISFVNCSSFGGFIPPVQRVNFGGFQMGKTIDSTLVNPRVDGYTHGIELIGNENLEVSNPQIKDCEDVGILIYDSDPTSFDWGTTTNLKVNGGTLRNNGLDGFDFRFFFTTVSNVNIIGTTIIGGEAAIGTRFSGSGSFSELYANIICTGQTVETLDNFGGTPVMVVDGKGDYIGGEALIGSTFKENTGNTLAAMDGEFGLVHGYFTVDDDSFVTFTTPKSTQVVTATTNDVTAYGESLIRASPSVVNISLFVGTNYDLATTALNGTTGVDGKVTIGADTSGNFYIENRRGATLSFEVSTR